ncbi:hypothetical protein LJ739_10925 [Aestuariibacter halophilus]|uniref:FlgO domain-containing protein n=1 Tax=Fluctibacter halophilus TaxID=226011 RepID=A0ABS8GAB9_9ALTE|nr:FlgO family outer membrane protein [Aestuariibacter halophilus]MCC2616755.1 hypothetical protein [Aestuariibacter halophilus]
MNRCNTALLTLLLTVLTVLAGCASESVEQVRQRTEMRAPANALGNIEIHTAELADELFASVPSTAQYRYAVATFVPADTLAYDPQMQGPLQLLGHQLAEGMMTEANRRGFITQDYKAASDIILSSEAERVLTRNIEQLATQRGVDFFITGTIVAQQEGAIVNARIIHARSQDVVAAATKFFPATLFWSREKVTTRQGKLYRTGS